MNNDNKKINDTLDKLWIDYLDLCENYQEQLPVYEFGFAMVRMASHMMFDCAPCPGVAYRTILAGIEAGQKEHEDVRKEEKTNE